MKIAVRLMDNVIDASWFPIKEVTESVKNHRRIGIGCVGWAEALIMLGIAYDSSEARRLAEIVTKIMYESAFTTSVALAKEKGSFPLVSGSIWAKSKDQPRNVAFLTFPPSSSNAVICETSYGIEPLFAIAYEQNVMDGTRLKTVNPLFLRHLEKRGIKANGIIEKIIENNGSVRGVKGVPADMQRVFKVAHDIAWHDHIKMQVAFQKWTDNAITKTINMPAHATPDDVEAAFMMAWKLGCKGLTIYRDKTKANQVFEFGGLRLCPTCNIKLVKDSKCFKCKKCGFSTCEL
jgi:ribonucleoside-diphosphate reductase alpha chain